MVETIKVYKGTNSVVINKDDLKTWNDMGFKTSAQRQKPTKKKAVKSEDE